MDIVVQTKRFRQSFTWNTPRTGDRQIQISLQSFLLISVAVGTAFGLAIAQPMVLLAILVVTLLGLLILLPIIPWLPLIEFSVEKDLGKQELISANLGRFAAFVCSC